MKTDMKIWVIPLLAGVLFTGCVQEELDWTIRDILDKPELYLGKNITIVGEYRGWESNCTQTGPPVTRSDWQIKDETGCIYVTGMLPGLDPYQDVGVRIEVAGTIKVNDVGVAYIEALEIKILSGNETTEPQVNKTGTIAGMFTEPKENITPPNLPD